MLFTGKYPVQMYLITLPICTQCSRKFLFIAANILIKAEFNQLFTSNMNKKQQSARSTLQPLETTSTFKNNVIVYAFKTCKINVISTS